MKKLIAVLVVCVLSFTLTTAYDKKEIKEEIRFDMPREKNGLLCIEGCDNLHINGYPMLPYKTKIYAFPFATEIKDVGVQVNELHKIHLKDEIAMAPPPAGVKARAVNIEKYPENWYEYEIRVGLYDGKESVILSLRLYPCIYTPDEILFAGKFDIKIEYELHPTTLNDEYDMVIIAPEKFIDELEPLKEHKENHGIKTFIKKVEDIYSSYNGRDNAEKVKYFIKDAKEKYGIKYVMLVGGLSSIVASNTWLVPVRYSHLEDSMEYAYLSDLYFADLYKYENGSIVFEDWDSNGNGVFGEWSFRQKDVIDLAPDVYLGRLACRNEKEVKTMVNKIIEYENNAYGQEWFKRLLLVAGDTFEDTDNYYEGEIANEKVAEYLSDFQPVKIWYSLGNLKQKNVIDAFSEGCGFVHFSGHGSPGMWLAKSFEGGKSKYILGLDIYHMLLLKNYGMYPVVVIGGCHNSMFNTTLYKSTYEIIASIILKYILGKPFVTWYWMPCYECFGWAIVRQKGGAIASIGCTGLGYGSIGDRNENGIPDCIEYFTGYIETHFFEIYSNGVDILGVAHTQALLDYINKFDPMKDRTDCKTVQEWVLLGDPSLKIGGYPE